MTGSEISDQIVDLLQSNPNYRIAHQWLLERYEAEWETLGYVVATMQAEQEASR